MSSLGRRYTPICLITLLLFIVIVQTPVTAQQTISNVVLNDVEIDVELHTNGTSEVKFSANVTNEGEETISNLNIRIELRGVHVKETIFDGAAIQASVIDQERYSLISLTGIQVPSKSSGPLLIIMITDVLQERIGICEEHGLCVENMIFYVRPLHVYQGLKFTAILPQHAVLEQETSALYPRPTSNHTDGSSLIFVWEVDQVLPGQERVYIIKYGIPNLTPTEIDTGGNELLLILVAMLGGAMIVIVVERTPRFLRIIRTPKIIAHGGLTQQENEILRFLSKKGGVCPQREIYRELGMSQSLASMILTGLEQRGMIKRFREGRENMVHLLEE